MIDNVHKAVGVGFIILNFAGQFLVGSAAREMVLTVIGCFIHLVAAVLLGFSMIMLMQTILQSHFFSTPSGTATNTNHQNDMDMGIVYFIFCITGLALTCIGVFLRAGSFYWNFGTIFLGFVASYCADPSVRKKLMPVVGHGGEDSTDTWSVSQKSPSNKGGANMRQRF